MKNGQVIKNLGGKHIVKSMGRCVVCNKQTFGYHDDPAPDPRGAVGLSAYHPLEASDYDMMGDNVCVCYGCRQESRRYTQALEIAKSQWTKKGE